MNCDTIKPLLHDYIDGILTDELVRRVDQHCETCHDCRSDLAALEQQKCIVATLPVPEPSAGFSRRVIENATRQAQTSARQPYKTRPAFGFAVAAVLTAIAVWLGLTEYNTNTQDLNRQGASEYVFTVGDDVRTVTVAIDAEQELDAVSMQVEVSNNLELKGFGNKKTIDWTTRLSPGVNVISLPVIGIAKGNGEIRTRVMLKGKQKEIRIKTRYQQPGNVFIDSLNRLG